MIQLRSNAPSAMRARTYPSCLESAAGVREGGTPLLLPLYSGRGRKFKPIPPVCLSVSQTARSRKENVKNTHFFFAMRVETVSMMVFDHPGAGRRPGNADGVDGSSRSASFGPPPSWIPPARRGSRRPRVLRNPVMAGSAERICFAAMSLRAPGREGKWKGANATPSLSPRRTHGARTAILPPHPCCILVVYPKVECRSSPLCAFFHEECARYAGTVIVAPTAESQ